MNEILYRYGFNFHKVVRQQNSGAVEDFILPYSAVYLRIQKWKNYWNRSVFAKVVHQRITANFFWPTLYIVGLYIISMLLHQIIRAVSTDGMSYGNSKLSSASETHELQVFLQRNSNKKA